jgi:hypothetical protein
VVLFLEGLKNSNYLSWRIKVFLPTTGGLQEVKKREGLKRRGPLMGFIMRF